MPDFPKFHDLHAVARNEAVARSQRLTVNAVDLEGSDANIMTAAGAAVGEECVSQLADVEEGFWLESCHGAKLDRWAFDRYGMTRKPAAPSFVYAQISTTAPAPAAFTLPQSTRFSTSDGREFISLVSIPYPLAAVGPVLVLARSLLAGIDQAIKAGSLKSITTSVPGAPADLTVTNTEASSSGANVESDDDFKARIRRFWLAARRGTKGAIETGALEVPGVVRAVSFEGLQSFGYPTRSVTLVISDKFTDALVKQGVSVPTYEAQSQALAYVVRTSLAEHRCYGIPVTVFVGQVRLIPVVLRLRFQASVQNTDGLALYVRTLVTQFINELDPGEKFDPADITELLRSVSGLEIFGDEVASPVGEIIPTSPYQVLRSSLGIVSFDSQATLQSQIASLI
jgi:hypothetical protein